MKSSSQKDINIPLSNYSSLRVGHSFTLLAPSLAILFGGTIYSNEEKSKMTNDIYTYNFTTKVWVNINYKNFNISAENIPAQRSYHASCCFKNNQLLIQGGIIQQNEKIKNNENETWIFDYNIYLENTNKKSVKSKNKKIDKNFWQIFPYTGDIPSYLYGHTLNYIKNFLILFGGISSKNRTEYNNNLYILDTENKNSSWICIKSDNNFPCERGHHTSCIYNNNLIIFGGRNIFSESLNDLWELKILDSSNIEWKEITKKNPNLLTKRYYHTMTILNNLLIIIGGITKSPKDKLPLEVYDLSNNKYYQFIDAQIYQHRAIRIKEKIYVFGGTSNKLVKIYLSKLFKNFPELAAQLKEIISKEAKEKLSKKINKNLYRSRTLSCFKKTKKNEDDKDKEKDTLDLSVNLDTPLLEKNNSNELNIISKQKNEFIQLQNESKFKLTKDVIIGKKIREENLFNNNISLKINDKNPLSKISINELKEENKKIKIWGNNNQFSIFYNNENQNSIIANKFIDILLRPFDWYKRKNFNTEKDKFPFSKNEIFDLISEAEKILKEDKSLIYLRSPCKIFGDINGQYNDLMKFFYSYGNPSDNIKNGDIYIMNYVFLGNFCDLGIKCLEVILLLLSLKIKYKENIFILRGKHEFINYNKIYGLAFECKEKLNDDINDENSVFMKLNNLFNFLPFGVCIDKEILCVSSGIGTKLKNLIDIENIKRPVILNEICQNDIAYQLLFSVYEENYLMKKKIKENETNLIYDEKILNDFLIKNNLHMIITSTELINEGIKSYNNDKLIMVNSSINYLDKYKNLGGIIVIGKKTNNHPIQINPKLIGLTENDKINHYRKDIKEIL